jgi:hypothetical protein
MACFDTLDSRLQVPDLVEMLPDSPLIHRTEPPVQATSAISKSIKHTASKGLTIAPTGTSATRGLEESIK